MTIIFRPNADGMAWSVNLSSWLRLSNPQNNEFSRFFASNADPISERPLSARGIKSAVVRA
jgi:hypothetical protein